MTALCRIALPATAALALAAPAQAASLRADHLRTGFMSDPVGIDDRAPTLSWELDSVEPGAEQQAYQLRVMEPHGQGRGGRVIWDSGRVGSGESAGVPYDGPALGSRDALQWTVRVWDGQGGPSPWAAPARFEMGLLETHRLEGPLDRRPARRSRSRPSRS